MILSLGSGFLLFLIQGRQKIAFSFRNPWIKPWWQLSNFPQNVETASRRTLVRCHANIYKLFGGWSQGCHPLLLLLLLILLLLILLLLLLLLRLYYNFYHCHYCYCCWRGRCHPGTSEEKKQQKRLLLACQCMFTYLTNRAAVINNLQIHFQHICSTIIPKWWRHRAPLFHSKVLDVSSNLERRASGWGGWGLQAIRQRKSLTFISDRQISNCCLKQQNLPCETITCDVSNAHISRPLNHKYYN